MSEPLWGLTIIACGYCAAACAIMALSTWLNPIEYERARTAALKRRAEGKVIRDWMRGRP